MVDLDIAKMREIHANLAYRKINDAFGDNCAAILKVLLEELQPIWQVIDCDRRGAALFVFANVIDPLPAVPNLPTTAQRGSDCFANGLQALTAGRCAIQVLSRGKFRVWELDDETIHSLSDRAIVYRWEHRIDALCVKGEFVDLPNPAPKYASTFSHPTFEELSEALFDFDQKVVRGTGCNVLNEIWHDKNRLFLRRKPEARMRDSMVAYLSARLRGIVRPEQNTDESKPVDIRVTWDFSNRDALIEIKWLGQSVDENGKETTAYAGARATARANEGAKQLAEYIDNSKTTTGNRVVRGFLAVVDARRRNLKEGVATLSPEDGLHFADKEIVYDPEYHTQRSDFEKPHRMFAEPICTPL